MFFVGSNFVCYSVIPLSHIAMFLSSQFFISLTENAEAIGGADLEDSVITVPIWFTEKQRIELR